MSSLLSGQVVGFHPSAVKSHTVIHERGGENTISFMCIGICCFAKYRCIRCFGFAVKTQFHFDAYLTCTHMLVLQSTLTCIHCSWFWPLRRRCTPRFRWPVVHSWSWSGRFPPVARPCLQNGRIILFTFTWTHMLFGKHMCRHRCCF